jgi:histidinol phosphatase-like enzyme
MYRNMNLPKLIVLDRDGVLNLNSSWASSPFYYITEYRHLIVKPLVTEALQIVKSLGVPTVMATKQRCLGKGLVTIEKVNSINHYLERKVNFYFDRIYVEWTLENKVRLYEDIKRDYPFIKPKDVWVFDDSASERSIAHKNHGFTDFDGTNLYEALTTALILK